ncbi:MAG: RNA polymerase factor sigma-54 [Planctomycetota bacterium]|nr:RNA polymerase factor sigma-54 [Planctomycetota bacterium]
MRLDLSQSFRLEQQMKLSPRLIQAMEILQLPMLALAERIDEELSSNPCLEVQESSDDVVSADRKQDESPDRGEETLVVDSDGDNKADFSRLTDFGEAYEEDFGWAERPYRRGSGASDGDAKLMALANTPAPEQSLTEYLLDQWAFVELTEQVKSAGRLIISNVDDDGYLRTSLTELSEQGDSADTDVRTLQSALAMVQKLDPPGVGARDLRECLLIQLDIETQAGHDVELPRLLVDEFLREIELNHIPQISKRTGRSVQEIKKAIVTLSRLDPRPGRIIGQRAVPYIIPDAVVDLDEEGNVIVTMRDGNTPALKVSETYRRMVRSRQADTGTKKFIRNNLRSAQWLISAIRQRRRTVRHVVEEVFTAQKGFLERGPEALKPLPMAKVASKVGVHVATVSRAVAGKYIQTPRGIFPLRMFFSGGKTTDDGQDVAWDAIKVKLRDVIDNEDKSSPLNDEQIAEALRENGVKIARRTVAKYRNLLSIPPARQRKEF